MILLDGFNDDNFEILQSLKPKRSFAYTSSFNYFVGLYIYIRWGKYFEILFNIFCGKSLLIRLSYGYKIAWNIYVMCLRTVCKNIKDNTF